MLTTSPNRKKVAYAGPKLSNLFVLLAVLGIIISAVSFVVVYNDHQAAVSYRHHAASSEATIDKKYTTGGRQKQYALEYTFNSNSGTATTKNDPVSYGYWEAKEPGDKIAVSYDTSHPLTAYIKGNEPTDATFSLIQKANWCLLLAALGYLVLRRFRR